VLTAPGWPRHLGVLRRQLRERRDALVAAVRQLLPSVRLDLVPAGGMHVWLQLPDEVSDEAVTAAAAARGLSVTPGRSSFPSEPPGSFLRLSYAEEDAAALRRAVDVLAGVLAAS
jgi:DNA-binding transcriptional MocR family regulator